MSKISIDLVGLEEPVQAELLAEQAGDLCRLRLTWGDGAVSSEADDFFEALCDVRAQLEPAGLMPFCYGASLNVFPSRMSRDMAKGKVAYYLERGKSGERTVRIFDSGPDVVPASVAAQASFHKEWLQSLGA